MGADRSKRRAREGGAIIAAVDPPSAGIVDIKVTGAATAALTPGRYTEVLRIMRAGKTSTLQGLPVMVVAAL